MTHLTAKIIELEAEVKSLKREISSKDRLLKKYKDRIAFVINSMELDLQQEALSFHSKLETYRNKYGLHLGVNGIFNIILAEFQPSHSIVHGLKLQSDHPHSLEHQAQAENDLQEPPKNHQNDQVSKHYSQASEQKHE